MVLFIWDALSCVANSGAAVPPLQSVQNSGKVKSLLTVLSLLLKGFEVTILSVLDGIIRLTAAISLKTMSQPTSDWNVFTR